MTVTSNTDTKFRLLYVWNRTVCAGILFTKQNGAGWSVWDIAPYLKKVIGRTPTAEIGQRLTSAGFQWEWSPEITPIEDKEKGKTWVLL